MLWHMVAMATCTSHRAYDGWPWASFAWTQQCWDTLWHLAAMTTSTFFVPTLTCMWQAQLGHSDAETRRCIWELWKLAHFIVPTLACSSQAQPGHSDSEARCVHGCYGNRHMSSYLRWPAFGKRSLDTAMPRHAVAYDCRATGTFQRAYAGLH